MLKIRANVCNFSRFVHCTPIDAVTFEDIFNFDFQAIT